MSNLLNTNNKALDNYPPEDEDYLVEMLTTIADGKFLIISITLAFLFLGITKAFLDKPIYKLDALLQIDEKPQALVRMESLSELVKSTMPVMAEVELIKSRMVLGEAIKNLDLTIVVEPRYFPLIGEAIAREYPISAPLFGHRYAWGGEAIDVSVLNVPDDFVDKKLILQAGTGGHFQIIFQNEVLIEGVVGSLSSKQINNNQQPFSILVSRLESRPGTQFIIKKLSENTARNILAADFFVTEKGKQTGILEMTLESSNPELGKIILNEIANIYVQQNVEHKSAESQKALEFLDKQLPELKNQMERSAISLNNYRNNKGSIDLDIETSNILKGSVEIKTQITLLQQKRDELRQRFTESHPSVIAVDKQISRLKDQLLAYDKVIKTLPETKQTIVDLSSDLAVNTGLYNSLLNKAQSLKVIKAGTVGDVRIIDYAVRPSLPIKPKRPIIIGFALILGIFIGIAVVFIRKMLYRVVEDPNLIEKKLHIPVYATIPYSKNQEVINKENKKHNKSGVNPVALLAKIAPEDSSIESLRSFRTTLHFSLLDAKNNIILISGPSPDIGKTFVSMNLTTVMADSGMKVLLIDADLRKGSLNKLFGVERSYGLSEIILNTITAKEAIHHLPIANIDFISTGELPPNPSELLLHERFGAFLESLTSMYDLIIIDSPPILAATDAAIISRFASATFMVAKAGKHTMRELEQSVKMFSQSGTQVKGVIFNGMINSASHYRYVYQYNYKEQNQGHQL